MISVARQLHENFREQHEDLCMAFVDLTKALDTVNRYIFLTFNANLAAIPLLLPYYNNSIPECVLKLSWQVLSFSVDVRVKQGCVLATIIFNLLLVGISLVSQRDLQPSDSVGIEFKSRCRKEETKCASIHCCFI